MATRRIVTPKKTGTATGTRRASAPKDTTAKSSTRIPPVKMMRTQVAPHVKTLANGQPRPKSRRSK